VSKDFVLQVLDLVLDTMVLVLVHVLAIKIFRVLVLVLVTSIR